MRRALKTLRQIRTFAHYHLEVQANPPKNGTKKRCYLSHLWEKWIYPMTFFITLEPLVIQRFTLPFQEQLQALEVVASKFRYLRSFNLNDLERPN